MTNLAEILKQRGLLLPREDSLLARPEVVVLTPEQQLTYLAHNRRVGFWVTAFAGGVRVMLLGGGVLAALYTAFFDRYADVLPFAAFGAVLALPTAWFVVLLFRRLRELKRPLPTYRELTSSRSRVISESP
jgi:hypothetical protein